MIIYKVEFTVKIEDEFKTKLFSFNFQSKEGVFSFSENNFKKFNKEIIDKSNIKNIKYFDDNYKGWVKLEGDSFGLKKGGKNKFLILLKSEFEAKKLSIIDEDINVLTRKIEQLEISQSSSALSKIDSVSKLSANFERNLSLSRNGSNNIFN